MLFFDYRNCLNRWNIITKSLVFCCIVISNSVAATANDLFVKENYKFATAHDEGVGSLYFDNGTKQGRLRLTHHQGPVIESAETPIRRFFIPPENAITAVEKVKVNALENRAYVPELGRKASRVSFTSIEAWSKKYGVTQTPTKGYRLIEFDAHPNLEFYTGMHYSRGIVDTSFSFTNSEINGLYSEINKLRTDPIYEDWSDEYLNAELIDFIEDNPSKAIQRLLEPGACSRP